MRRYKRKTSSQDKHKTSRPGKREIPTCEQSSGGCLPIQTSEDNLQAKNLSDSEGIIKIDSADDEPVIIEEVKVNIVAGRLGFFLERWKEITSDRYILECVNGYKIQFTEIPYQAITPKEKTFSPEEMEKMQIQINELIIKGAIKECEECEGQFVSSFFLVPKPDGSDRFIVNLKNLNKFIDAIHFKLEDIRSELGLVSPGHFLGLIELKDAYFLVPIYIGHRKFLRFRFEDKLY